MYHPFKSVTEHPLSIYSQHPPSRSPTERLKVSEHVTHYTTKKLRQFICNILYYSCQNNHLLQVLLWISVIIYSPSCHFNPVWIIWTVSLLYLELASHWSHSFIYSNLSVCVLKADNIRLELRVNDSLKQRKYILHNFKFTKWSVWKGELLGKMFIYWPIGITTDTLISNPI